MLRRGPFLAVVEGSAAPAEILPGAEATARAREDHDPDLVVGVDLVEEPEEIVAHRRVERVQALGPVQGDGENAFFELGEQGFVRHRGMIPGAGDVVKGSVSRLREIEPLTTSPAWRHRNP